VLDDTGSGDGWAVDAYLSGSSGLPSGSVLDFDGVGSATLGTTTDSSLYSFPFAAVTPSTVCDNESSCVLATPASNCAATSGCPVDPVQLSGAGQVDLYSAAAGSGEGDLCLASGTASAPDCAGTTPTVFFDLGVPASARLGSYATASIVLTLASGP
jgi:hypothetical protein